MNEELKIGETKTIAVDHGSIQLERNTKGYNWCIKMYSDGLRIDELTLLELDKINKICNEKYGDKPETKKKEEIY